jgi:hypothetical protein
LDNGGSELEEEEEEEMVEETEECLDSFTSSKSSLNLSSGDNLQKM